MNNNMMGELIGHSVTFPLFIRDRRVWNVWKTIERGVCLWKGEGFQTCLPCRLLNYKIVEMIHVGYRKWLVWDYFIFLLLFVELISNKIKIMLLIVGNVIYLYTVLNLYTCYTLYYYIFSSISLLFFKNKKQKLWVCYLKQNLWKSTFIKI